MRRTAPQQVAGELGMVVVGVPRNRRDALWEFIALNLERLRPVGFDGHVVYCRPENEEEINQLLKT